MPDDIRDSRSPHFEQRANEGAGALLRLGWMVAGNGVLAVLAATILLEPRWTMSAKDVLYWLVVASVIALRYVDITRYGGLTADGQPATRRTWTRYSIGLVLIASALWALVQSINVA